MKTKEVVIVEQEKNVFGKKTGRFRARLNGHEFDFFAHGITKEEAVAKLHARLESLVNSRYVNRYFKANDGTVFRLYQDGDNFAYDIVSFDPVKVASTFFGAKNLEEASKRVENHVAQFNSDLIANAF